MTISLKPPAVPSLKSTTLTFHPLLSQYLVYIRYRSPAKIDASSPPVPARSSITTFFVSSGSFGINIKRMVSSSSKSLALTSSNSSFAIIVISGSEPSDMISSASFCRWVKSRYCFRFSINLFKSLYSRFRAIYRFWSAMISG